MTRIIQAVTHKQLCSFWVLFNGTYTPCNRPAVAIFNRESLCADHAEVTKIELIAMERGKETIQGHENTEQNIKRIEADYHAALEKGIDLI